MGIYPPLHSSDNIPNLYTHTTLLYLPSPPHLSSLHPNPTPTLPRTNHGPIPTLLPLTNPSPSHPPPHPPLFHLPLPHNRHLHPNPPLAVPPSRLPRLQGRNRRGVFKQVFEGFGDMGWCLLYVDNPYPVQRRKREKRKGEKGRIRERYVYNRGRIN